jgi:hypothetical protein
LQFNKNNMTDVQKASSGSCCCCCCCPLASQDDNFDTDKTRGFIGNAITGVLPGVFTSIDEGLGNKLPLTRRLLQLLRLAPGKEFESVREVLSLYDKQELEKLAEDGKMSLDVPEGKDLRRYCRCRCCCCSWFLVHFLAGSTGALVQCHATDMLNRLLHPPNQTVTLFDLAAAFWVALARLVHSWQALLAAGSTHTLVHMITGL